MLPSINFDKGPIFVIGAAHAGKSELATKLMLHMQEEISKKGGHPLNNRTVFIGTAMPEEQAFRLRLDALKALRPKSWQTIEEPVSLVNTLDSVKQETGKNESQYVLIDSINQWIAALLYTGSGKYSVEQLGVYVLDEVRQFVELLQKMKKDCTKNLIVVSSEVGAGISPQRHIEGLFREMVGLANQRIAEVSGTVIHVTAGIAAVIKS